MRHLIENSAPIVIRKANPELGDVVFIAAEPYKITGETKTGSSWKLSHIGKNPFARKSDSYNKNTFLNRYRHDGRNWLPFTKKKNIYKFSD